MRYALASLALAAVASAAPQVTSAISPSGSSPAGCSSSYSGTFAIQVVNVTSSAKRDIVKRQSDSATTLILSLSNGKLTDSKGRTGYIAANDQFQFDGPPQTGAIYTSGWSVCSNGSLALGDDAIFYQCLSGNFYNLYDKSTGAQCSPVYIDVIGGSSSAVATVQSDGQPTASAVASQISDGQITASAVSSAVSQISDGQVQATTAAAVSQISDGQIQATTSAAAVSQISDGQIQATTAAAVSQISDGQIQATTAAAVSQISDGQIQATTAAAVSQISDGQIQATTAAVAPVSQISDGQIQATTGANSTYGSPSATVVPYTGAAMPTALRGELFGLAAAGVMAVAML